MGKNKNINAKFKSNKTIIPTTDLANYSKMLSTLTNSVIGFNPNQNYSVKEDFKPSNLPAVPKVIKSVQESLINLGQNIADSLINSRKFIYSMEPRVYNPNGAHKYKVYILKMVQQSKQGIVPSVLILSNSESDEKGYKIQKSTFSVCLNGKKYITLDRIDAMPKLRHHNMYLGNDGKMCYGKNAEKRFIRAKLSHRHIYRQVVILNTTKHLIDDYIFKQSSVNMFKDPKNYNMDAILIDQIKDFDDIITRNLDNLNICPFIFNEINEMAEKDVSLSKIFDKCQEMEMNFSQYQQNVKYDISKGIEKIEKEEEFKEF